MARLRVHQRLTGPSSAMAVRRAPGLTAVLIAAFAVVAVILAGIGLTPLSSKASAATGYAVTPIQTAANGERAQALESATLACGKVSEQAPKPEGLTYRYAVWSEKERPATLPSDFLSNVERSGRQMLVDSVTCNADGTFTIVPAPSVGVGTEQGNVELTADAAAITGHLQLVYLAADLSITVPVTVEGQDVLVSGRDYDPDAHTALFTRNDKGVYTTQLTVSVPRRSQPVVTSAGGSASKDLDTSITTRTVQTFTVTAPQTNAAVTVKAASVTQTTTYMPALSFPADKGTGGNQSNFNIGARVQRYQSCPTASPVDACAALATKKDPENQLYDNGYWRQDYGTAAQVSSPTPNVAASYKLSQYADATKTSINHGDSFAVPVGGTAAVYVDVLPYLSTIKDASYHDAMNAMLASITINGQVFTLPMPRLCLPRDAMSPDDLSRERCRWIGPWSGDWHDYYEMARTFAMGTDAEAAACKAADKWYGCEWLNAEDTVRGPNVIFDRRILDGVNAGSRIRVSIVNARNGVDTYPLLDNSGHIDSWHYINAAPNYMRWRLRYRIEVIDTQTSTLEIGGHVEWNTHNRVMLSDTVGVQANASLANETASLQAYGHHRGESKNTWYSLCATNVSGTGGCSYIYQEEQPAISGSNGSRLWYRFQVKNGFTNPWAVADELWGSGERALLKSSDVSGSSADGNYLYFSTRPSADFQKTLGSEVYFANAIYPMTAHAEPYNIPVTYKDASGNSLAGYTQGSLVDVARNSILSLPNKIPTGYAETFQGWDVWGYKNGQKVGLIRAAMRRGSNFDIKDLTFANLSKVNGALAGTRALTNEYGQPIITEIRVVPNTGELSDEFAPATYPVLRSLDAAQPSELFSYRAVPGLTARLTQDYRTANATISEGGNTYRLLADGDGSRLATALTGTPTENPLLLAYERGGTSLTFAKTVDPTQGKGISLAGDAPSASDFALRIGEGAQARYVSGGQTLSDLEPGTYPLAEVSSRGRQEGTYSWDNTWGAVAPLSCTKADGSAVTLTDGQITIADGDEITCAATNSPAALTLMAVAPGGSPITADGVGLALASTQAGALGAGEVWAANGEGGLISPGVAYSVSEVHSGGYAMVALERYDGTYTDSPAADSPLWKPVDLKTGLSVKAGEHAIYRMVLIKSEVQLPITGGHATDAFLLAGLGALGLGAVGGVLARRRQGRL